jgi:hypothetical protein
MPEDTRKTPEEIMGMSDDEVRRMALTGNENSRTFVFGVAEMNMRSTLRFAAAVEATARANQDLVTTTKQVVDAHQRSYSTDALFGNSYVGIGGDNTPLAGWSDCVRAGKTEVRNLSTFSSTSFFRVP